MSLVQLLQAEQFSYQNHHDKAKASYAAAISSARSSGFIHEQGLACELAGYHFKKVGDSRSACGFFEQAKQCYTAWGSLVKVESVTRELNCVRASMHDDRDDTSGENSFVGMLFDVVKSYSTIDLN
jgi:ATP-dependent RNA helicase DDX31/DBP7